LTSTYRPSLIPEDAFEKHIPKGTLGAEEELWLADPQSMKLASGAQKILHRAPEGSYRGELIDCEIESNTDVHEEPSGVLKDLVARRRYLFAEVERLGRVLGASGTHPIGDWREQQIIDEPRYRRLEDKLGWLIRRTTPAGCTRTMLCRGGTSPRSFSEQLASCAGRSALLRSFVR
jgi:carboxylate-amine ligase